MNVKHVLLGITGSIGCVEIQNYLVELRNKFDFDIHVIMTDSACRLIRSETVRYFINGEVFTSLYDREREFRIPHAQLADWADLMIILPATANIIGKIAHGIADDLLSTAVMAVSCPVIVVPNMNDRMFSRLAVQRNLEQLVADGYHVLRSEEEATKLSTGQKIKGGMPSPLPFVDELERWLITGTFVSGGRT